MAELTADVLAVEGPDPELLVRYARDPHGLTEIERASVEAQLRESPGASAQLALLRRALAGSAVAPRLVRSAPRRARAVAIGLLCAAAAAAAIVVQSALPLAPWGGGGPGRATDPPQSSDSAGSEPVGRSVDSGIALAAVLPQYRAPHGADPRPRLATRTRGTRDPVGLELLVPEHTGRTARSSPALAWWLWGAPGPGSRLELALAPEGGDSVLARAELEAPQSAGLQRTPLAVLGDFELPLQQALRWTIALRPAGGGAEPIAQGFIVRVELDAAQLASLGSAPEERAAAAARLGLWYDALDPVVQRAIERPSDPWARAALASLLEPEGLGEIARAAAER